MTDEKQDQSSEEDEPREKTRKGMDARTPSRDEFFANLEQVSKPDEESNGEKASKSEGSQPESS